MTPAPKDVRQNYVKPRDPLELMLAAIWEETLGRSPIGVAEPFDAEDGDAARLATMLARVEQACGRTVPESARSPELTVASLAVAMKALARSPESNRNPAYFVRNRPRAGLTTRPPFFFLHGDIGGGGFYCVALAGHLGKDQPFYALAPHGVDGSPLPPTIQAMAAAQREILRGIRPTGPYRIGGHCNGALIAYEVARQLVAEGEHVERLILVAPLIAPALPRRFTLPFLSSARWGAYYLKRLRALARAPVRDQLHYVGRKLRGSSMPPPVDMPAVPPWDDGLFDAYWFRMRAYRPGSYLEPLTILWPIGEPERLVKTSTRVWRHVAPAAEIREVPGDHVTCITTRVGPLAAAMRACLEKPE